MNQHLAALTLRAHELAAVDRTRAELAARRDAAIVAALSDGATWQQVQDASGLNPSAVAKAIRRHQSVGNRPTASARRSSPTPT